MTEKQKKIEEISEKQNQKIEEISKKQNKIISILENFMNKQEATTHKCDEMTEKQNTISILENINKHVERMMHIYDKDFKGK